MQTNKSAGFPLLFMALCSFSASPTYAENVLCVPNGSMPCKPEPERLADRPHHVYVYRTVANQNYQCADAVVYVETLGFSSFTAVGCVSTSWDRNPWPPFPKQPIATDMQFMGKPARIFQSCSFVAHAMSANRNTSTVIDCR